MRCINLIGGVKTARMLAERAGRTLKRTVLELGGYNPMIILDDVDVDYAVRMATFGSFFHQGQICLNTRKIIIQRGIYDEFLEKFVDRTKTLPSGDPLDPHTIIGPLVTQAAVDLMDERVKEAVVAGRHAAHRRHPRGTGLPADHPHRRPVRGHRIERRDLRAAGHRRSRSTRPRMPSPWPTACTTA